MIRLAVLFFLILLIPAMAGETVLPREILSVYYHEDGAKDPRLTPLHRRGEMILNHLGLTVKHHNLADGMPSPQALEGVRGVVAWFATTELPDPEGFIAWAAAIPAGGRKLVIAGEWAFANRKGGGVVSVDSLNPLLKTLGLYTDGTWVPYTYGYEISTQNEAFIPFESPPAKPFPAFPGVFSSSPETRILLALSDKRQNVPVVMAALSAAGGYLGPNIMFKQGQKETQLQWIVNPFEFFRATFDTDELPKPDSSTLSGRRIYYSHIDGDGWNNLGEMKDSSGRAIMASEVIRDQVIGPFPDLPVSVAPVAADIDQKWRGTKRGIEAARTVLALPQVEAGTHTYTHPFAWSFFEHYDPEREKRFRSGYLGTGSKARRLWGKLTGQGEDVRDVSPDELAHGHSIPRAYLDEPFSLDMEVSGSVKVIEDLLPKGKHVKIMQWPGDTSPFEAAIAATEAAGLANINGGDTRLDAEYPSVAWVAPIGQKVGSQIQIYSSNSNENTYTELWTNRFFGFRFLANTVRNTETPVRLKPFNLYYHTYSGEKLASLNALLENLRYARNAVLVPIATSEYARIARGFFTVRFVKLGVDQWRIEKRGQLQTIRFDRATFKAVDMEHSSGVLGQIHTQGSLYVSLDEASAAPVIALKPHLRPDESPQAQRPYLADARWRMKTFTSTGEGGFSVEVQGYGDGDMTWIVPRSGRYVASLATFGGIAIAEQTAEADSQGTLRLSLQANAQVPLRLTVTRTRP